MPTRYLDLIAFVEAELPLAQSLGLIAAEDQAVIMRTLPAMRAQPENPARAAILAELLRGWRKHLPPEKRAQIDGLLSQR